MISKQEKCSHYNEDSLILFNKNLPIAHAYFYKKKKPTDYKFKFASCGQCEN